MINYNNLIFRTGTPDNFISVVVERCKGCRKCEIICPMDLWRIIDKKAHLNEDYKELCLECGHCYSICEQDAILFHYPKGGTGVIYKHG